jgi:UDP-galactopyranose mutase
MNRKLVLAIVLAASFAGAGLTGAAAFAQSEADVPVVEAGQNQWYTVYYYNVRFPNRVHVYGTYSRWVDAVRVSNFVNSFPEYVAYIR